MFAVRLAIAAAALNCAACAQNDVSATNAFHTGRMNLVGPAAAGELMPATTPQKTLASKVLSAIALEKVTGLKPDPERFRDLD